MSDPTAWPELIEKGGIAFIAGLLLWMLARGGARLLTMMERREESVREGVKEMGKQTELLRLIADRVLQSDKSREDR